MDVVYDSVGLDTFDRSLSCLRPRGYMVFCGQASGAVPPFDPQILRAKSSIFLTRPSLEHYTLTRDELLYRADAVYSLAAAGKLKAQINHELPLAEAADAHRALASRTTVGKVLLVV